MGVQVPLSAPKYVLFAHFPLAQKIIILLALYTGMKGIKLFFCVCLGMLAFGHAFALDGDDTARAATRRGASGATATTPITNRTTPSATTPKTTTPRTATTATTVPRTANESRTAVQNTGVVPRTQSIRSVEATRPTTQTRSTQPATQSRRATTVRTGGASRSATTATPRTTKNIRSKNTTARVATNESGAIVTNYTKCREIFYECMDEFCATKDANLRRCACSSRSTEFDDIKKQMTNVENKMLDFNQRLLLVNMDAEDVNAINTATEGEDAFYSTRDTTKSKRALDDIAKKLNAKFGGDSNYGGGLGAISLTLNVDAAFDTVDSFMGIDTTTKSGVALYNAAIPICHDIAREVCTDEEMSLAQSGYQMQIEQDCNTVKKAYQAQVDQARAKVFESSALLDMSRLDAYQTRNSDDLLTCKRKMLDMLTDTTVCGAKMEKCLDMTGRYIDPTTGAAFLSVNLADLDTMITRPGVNQTWTSANSNGKFITFLKDRKKYLSAATENCEDIADTVWDAFIEDALAQIKLAQTAKLEEIRQACTKLTTECLDTANDSIENFDARALSIFGIMADRTANTMCADVRASCSNLLGATGDESWESGVHEISTTLTYESIISSCTQVGQNCIIQACKSISGNFDLCDDINFSANRHSILERISCWPEVKNCVASAGDSAIMAIMENLGHSATQTHAYSFYRELYNTENLQINDICATDCELSDAKCATCRIAERIWGNCEDYPSITIGTGSNAHNRIHMPQNGQSTLLSWFAINTGTATPMSGGAYQSDPRSCVNTRCTSSDQFTTGEGDPICLPEDVAGTDTTSEGMYCPVTPNGNVQIQITNTLTNCCFAEPNQFNTVPMGNSNDPCCEGEIFNGIESRNICVPSGASPITPVMQSGSKYIICIGNVTAEPTSGITGYPSGNEIHCSGRLVLVDTGTNEYSNPITSSGNSQYDVSMVYYDNGDNRHAIPIDVDDIDATNWFIHYYNE